MQTGFAMLCAGSIRAKNVKNVILWNLLDSCGGGLAFWAVGYAFAYGGDDDGPKTFIGNTHFFLRDFEDFELWFFQFAFACALSSIVAGTIAERTKMTAYLLYSVFLVGFCYPVVRFHSTDGAGSSCWQQISSVFNSQNPDRLHTHSGRPTVSSPTRQPIPSGALEPSILPDLDQFT
jgi:ammonia channel protein AmtB